jgi:hypothetical protein
MSSAAPVKGMLLATAVALLPGCAAVVLPAAAVSVLGAAAGAAVQAGTEYTASGAAYRTLVVPVDEVAWAMHQTFQTMGFAIERDEATAEGRRMTVRAEDRTIKVRVQRLSAATSRIRLLVTQDLIFRDRSTASEILAQLEATLVRDGKLGRRPAP